MSGSARLLLKEMRQSPVKAGVLCVGIAAALVIWGPRLAAGFGKDVPRPRATGNAGEAAAAGAPASGSDARRDPASIRAEFIRISAEARGLREVALPVAVPAIARDPFAAPASALAAAAVPVQPSADAEEVLAESERAAALRLEGVFHFRNGSSAVLDGVVLRKGDEHQGFTVVAIEGRSVRLRGAHAQHRVTMEDEKER